MYMPKLLNSHVNIKKKKKPIYLHEFVVFITFQFFILPFIFGLSEIVIYLKLFIVFIEMKY